MRIEELHRPLLTTEKMFVDDYGNCDSEEISTEAFTIEFPDPPKIKVCTEVDYALGIEQENGTGSEMPELDSVNSMMIFSISRHKYSDTLNSIPFQT